MILPSDQSNPTHVVARRNGGVRIGQGPAVVYLSRVEMRALADVLNAQIKSHS